MKDGKMSKSKGNVIDPMILLERYGSDSLRYYLLREISFGADGVFSNESMLQRFNTDLANDLGNLLSRTLTMVERFFAGTIPAPETGGMDPSDRELRELALSMPSRITEFMDKLQLSTALETLWGLVRRSNKYIDENAPWLLAKKEEDRGRLGTVLYNLCESLRFISVLLLPYMPRTPMRIWSQLGIDTMPELHRWDSLEKWGFLEPGTKAQRTIDLFPRLDIEKELISLLEGEEGSKDPDNMRESRKEQEQEAFSADSPGPTREEKSFRKEVSAKNADDKPQTPADKPALVSIEDFLRVDIRVGEIVSAEPVPKTDKLLKLIVNLGQEERQVVAGIALHYAPAELVGKKALFVANLKPAKIRGLRSEGMILAASDPGGKVVLTAVDGDLPAGSRIS
jgi:methionyl-tRNA synthetase